jgi:hypothetical protein
VAFDNLRKSLEEMMSRATKPEDRREIAHRMRETLVQAKVGLSEMRDALEKARARLAHEERELATMSRRKQLAEGINDAETAKLAAEHEAKHAQRVDLLRKKIVVQEDEIRIAEADVESMSAEMRAAASGTGAYAPNVPTSVMPESDDSDAPLAAEIDALGRASARAQRQAEADQKLEELKRRMGK